MSRIRRAFTPEHKQEAVRQVVEQGRPVSQVARELSLRPEQLRIWKQQLTAQGAVPLPSRVESADDEVRRLRRELAVRHLRERYQRWCCVDPLSLPRRSSRKGPCVVRRDRAASRRVSADPDVSRAGGVARWLSCVDDARSLSAGARGRGAHGAHRGDASSG